MKYSSSQDIGKNSKGIVQDNPTPEQHLATDEQHTPNFPRHFLQARTEVACPDFDFLTVAFPFALFPSPFLAPLP